MDGPDLWVHGSGKLINTLLANDLIDQMLVWTFPLTIGSGQRLFPEGTPPVEFKFVDSRTFPTGVVITTYEVSFLAFSSNQSSLAETSRSQPSLSKIPPQSLVIL